MNGPPDTIGWPAVGWLLAARSPLPAPAASGPQTCSGKIGICSRFASGLAVGLLYVRVREPGLVALARTMSTTVLAHRAAAPLRSRTMVLIVHAASCAVSGLPSDHLACGTIANVSVRPPFDSFQEVAKSGSKPIVLRSYWISLG